MADHKSQLIHPVDLDAGKPSPTAPLVQPGGLALAPVRQRHEHGRGQEDSVPAAAAAAFSAEAAPWLLLPLHLLQRDPFFGLFTGIDHLIDRVLDPRWILLPAECRAVFASVRCTFPESLSAPCRSVQCMYIMLLRVDIS